MEINALTTAAIVAGVGTYVLSFSKNFISKIHDFIINRVTCVLTVTSSSHEFGFISKYIFHLYNYHKFMPTNSFRPGMNLLIFGDDSDETKADLLKKRPNYLQLGEGTFYIKHEKYGIMKVNLNVDDEKQTANSWAANENFGEKATLSIRFFNNNVDNITDFMRESVSFSENDKIKNYLYFLNNSNEWVIDYSCTGREWSSVVLPSEQKQRILKDIAGFFNNEEMYRRASIPYRRGMLLHGKPGTGKTSIVRAIQDKLKLPVYVVNLKRLSDTSLLDALRTVPNRAIILFEDFDAVVSTVHKREEKPNQNPNQPTSALSLSAFLNSIDGAQSPEHVYFVFTTNHPEVLDEAVVRKGRVDVQEEFKFLNKELQKDLIMNILPEELWENAINTMVVSDEAKACDIQAQCFDMFFQTINKETSIHE